MQVAAATGPTGPTQVVRDDDQGRRCRSLHANKMLRTLLRIFSCDIELARIAQKFKRETLWIVRKMRQVREGNRRDSANFGFASKPRDPLRRTNWYEL